MPVKNYKQRLASLKGRRTDGLLNKAVMSKSFSSSLIPETARYVFESMSPIEDEYTKNTYAEADRVKNQISNNLTSGVEVEYDQQGSVPLGIHIKLHSDLDILVIHNKFHTLENPQIVTTPYLGDPLSDLRNLRNNVYQTLSTKFPEADVDNTKAKCVSICKGSLRRKFDLIVANWFNTNTYSKTWSKKDRGLQIYDKVKDQRFKDYPFSHMYQVELKTSAVYDDNYRRVIRLLKNLKADADVNIDLSSFMITSIMYHMSNADFMVIHPNSTKLLINTSRHLDYVIRDENFRRGLYSPNNTELLFAEGDLEKVAELRKLKKELDDTITDLGEELRNNTRFFSGFRSYGMSINEALEKAIIHY